MIRFLRKIGEWITRFFTWLESREALVKPEGKENVNTRNIFEDQLEHLDKMIAETRKERDRARSDFRSARVRLSEAESRMHNLVAQRELVLRDLEDENMWEPLFPEDEY